MNKPVVKSREPCPACCVVQAVTLESVDQGEASGRENESGRERVMNKAKEETESVRISSQFPPLSRKALPPHSHMKEHVRMRAAPVVRRESRN